MILTLVACSNGLAGQLARKKMVKSLLCSYRMTTRRCCDGTIQHHSSDSYLLLCCYIITLNIASFGEKRFGVCVVISAYAALLYYLRWSSRIVQKFKSNEQFGLAFDSSKCHLQLSSIPWSSLWWRVEARGYVLCMDEIGMVIAGRNIAVESVMRNLLPDCQHWSKSD